MDDGPDGTIRSATDARDARQSGATHNDRLAIFPGKSIRPIPGFVFTVPRGWVLDEAAEVLTVVRTPQEVDGFWVNAVVTHERVARAVDLKVAARITWERVAADAPKATIALERLARFGPTIAYLRGVDFPTSDTARAVSQLQAMIFAPVGGEGKTVDLFQIVCTAPQELMANFSSPFMEIIGSFRFT